MQFVEEEYTLRITHDYHCSLIEGVHGSFDSTTYSINERSPLNQIDLLPCGCWPITSRHYACHI